MINQIAALLKRQLPGWLTGKKYRYIEILAEEGFIKELNRLAEASGTTRAEVIDRAIGLYAIALHEAERGKTIKFVFPDS